MYNSYLISMQIFIPAKHLLMAIKYLHFKVHFFARSYDRTTQKDIVCMTWFAACPSLCITPMCITVVRLTLDRSFFLGGFFFNSTSKLDFCVRETDIYTHNMCCASFIQWSPSVFSVMQRLIKKWRALLAEKAPSLS